MIKRMILAAFLSLALFGGAPGGCATRRAVVTAEAPVPAIVVDADDDDGGVFEIIGDIIALPFRAVGALLSAIF